MILKLLITRGNNTLIPREATQERKRKFENATRKSEKERIRRIKSSKKMIHTNHKREVTENYP